MPVRSNRNRAIFVILGVACVLLLWRLAEPGAGAVPPAAGESATPVAVARALRRDTAVDIDSVGTVQAFNSALLRARVDGQISRAAFREGTHVKRGDVLFELDRGPFEAQVRAAQAQKANDAARLANARADLARYESLVTSDAVTPQALDAARSLAVQLQASVATDQAQLDAAALQLGYATIRAPFDGRVGARQLDVGNMVHPGDAAALVSVVQLQPVGVSFTLPQRLLGALRAQQARAPLHVDAVAEDGRTVLDSGALVLIDNQIDATTGTIRCKAEFPNGQEQLWPGSFVTARIHFDVLPQAVVVPASAVLPGPESPFVWVVDTGLHARMQPVRTGATAAGQTVVLSGLGGGETVVVEGQFQLEQGALVQVRPEPARPAGSGAPASGG